MTIYLFEIVWNDRVVKSYSSSNRQEAFNQAISGIMEYPQTGKAYIRETMYEDMPEGERKNDSTGSSQADR